jgi:hypothetical protein
MDECRSAEYITRSCSQNGKGTSWFAIATTFLAKVEAVQTYLLRKLLTLQADLSRYVCEFIDDTQKKRRKKKKKKKGTKKC